MGFTRADNRRGGIRTGQMRRASTYERDHHIVRLHQAGFGQVRIGEIHQISQSTVCRVIKRLLGPSALRVS